MKAPAHIVTMFNKIVAEAKTLFGADLIALGWKIELNTRKKAVGLCNYSNKTIYISKHYVNEPTIKETIAHEVAHALTPGHHHDSIWAKVCKILGGTGKRCNATVTPTEAEWLVINTLNNDVVAKYYKKPRRCFERCSLRGMPETLGKLKLVKATDFIDN